MDGYFFLDAFYKMAPSFVEKIATILFIFIICLFCVCFSCPTRAETSLDTGAWASRFETGATGTQGNSETFDYRAAFGSVYQTDETRLKLDASYFYGSNEDMITRNEYTAGILNDWFFAESPWSIFVDGRYDWNAFEFWESRISVHGGVANKIIDAEDIESYLRMGGGATKEYGSENEDIKPEGLVGGEITWRIAEGQELYGDITYYPDFSTSGEYRILSSFRYKVDINSAKGISMGIGAEDEYQSAVDPGFEHNNLKYYSTLAIDF